MSHELGRNGKWVGWLERLVLLDTHMEMKKGWIVQYNSSDF